MGLPPYVTSSGGRVFLDVFVQPRAAKQAVVGVHGRALKLKVKAPPLDGRANSAVEGFVAEILGVPGRDVEVVSGHASRNKRLEVHGMAAADIACELVRVVSSPAHEPGKEAVSGPQDQLQENRDG